MKIFISLSVFAMVLAGIYGFTDMANDIHNGTMIRYGEEAKAQRFIVAAHFVGAGKNAHKPKLVKATRVKAEQKVALVAEPKFSIEDISRGEPEAYELLPVVQAGTVIPVDSAATADSTSVSGN